MSLIDMLKAILLVWICFMSFVGGYALGKFNRQ